MLRNKKYILTVITILTIATTGCYEPSDIDAFDSGEPAIVIEGLITDHDSTSTVTVSRSVSAKDTNDYLPVNNALVLLRDDMGNSAQLENIGNGKYQTSEIIGIPEHEYLLTVEVDGMRYNSIELMPKAFDIDSIIVEYKNSRTLFDTIGYYISVFTPKIKDTIQYYRIEIEKNNKQLNGYSNLWLFEDSHEKNFFRMDITHDFELGDTVIVKVFSISPSIYEYLFGLSKQFSVNFSNIQPPLTNPESNINPTALGYFQVSSVNTYQIVIGSEMYQTIKISDL